MFILEITTEIDKFRFFIIRIQDVKKLRMLHPCSITFYDSDIQKQYNRSISNT